MDYAISITNKCNLKCTYCYERKLNTELGNIDDETADNIIRFISRRNDAGVIFLFGGEPLLYKNLIRKFVNSLTANLFVITTNGMLLEEEFIKWCMKNNVRINLSHDGADCSARGIKAEDLNEKLKLLLKYQPDTLIQLVYTEKTLRKLSENVMYLKKIGVRKISLAMDSFTNPADPDSFGDLLKEEWDKVASIEDMYIRELEEKKKRIEGRKKSLCLMCRKKMYINWDGKIYPCTQFQNLPDFYCGDVVNGLDYYKALESHPDYSSLSRRCEGCEISEYCNNSCACRKMSSTGTLSDISEAACLEEQVLILTVLEQMQKNNKVPYVSAE